MTAFLRFAHRLKDGLIRSDERNRRLGLRSALMVKFLALRIDSNERINIFRSVLSTFLREIQLFIPVPLASLRFTLQKKQMPTEARHTVFFVVRSAQLPCSVSSSRTALSSAPRLSGKPAAWMKTQAVRIGSLPCVPPMPGIPFRGSRYVTSPSRRMNALTNNNDCESVQKIAPTDLVPENTVQLQGRQIACAPRRSETRLFKNKNGQPAVSLASCGAQQTGSNLLSRETLLGSGCSAKPKHKTLWASLRTRTHPLACGLTFLCSSLRARVHHPAIHGSNRSQACSPLSPPPSRTQPSTPRTFSGVFKDGIGGRETMGSRLAPKRSLRSLHPLPPPSRASVFRRRQMRGFRSLVLACAAPAPSFRSWAGSRSSTPQDLLIRKIRKELK
jgi:hypothetical protein